MDQGEAWREAREWGCWGRWRTRRQVPAVPPAGLAAARADRPWGLAVTAGDSQVSVVQPGREGPPAAGSPWRVWVCHLGVSCTEEAAPSRALSPCRARPGGPSVCSWRAVLGSHHLGAALLPSHFLWRPCPSSPK